MKFALCMLIISFSISSHAFLDKLFEKVGGAGALAAGADDLISELDDSSTLLNETRMVGQTVTEARDLLTDIDGTVYDINYVGSSIDRTEETANKLHAIADKSRRVKRLAKRLGIISMDAPTAAAMEQIRTNTILDNYVSDRKDQELAAKEERLRRLIYMAKRERLADKSLSNAVNRTKARDRQSGVAFNPFTVPNGTAAVNDNIMMSLYSSSLTSGYGF